MMRILALLTLAVMLVLFVAVTILVFHLSSSLLGTIIWLILMWGYYIFIACVIIKNVRHHSKLEEEMTEMTEYN